MITAKTWCYGLRRWGEGWWDRSREGALRYRARGQDFGGHFLDFGKE